MPTAYVLINLWIRI